MFGTSTEKDFQYIGPYPTPSFQRESDGLKKEKSGTAIMVAQEAEVVMAEDIPSPLSGELSQGSSDNNNNNKRKTGSGRMSKVRGILSGKSWRDKRKMKQAKNGAANDTASKHSGDEESTTYGVDVDENSKSAAALAATKKLLSSDNDDDHEETDLFNENEVAGKKYLLKIVLLLMDNKSRRFELLQLEFDSVKASVSDVLAQIPIAVTEACLQEQSYMGITCCDGVEKSPQDLLAGFCKGGDVMVAIAQGMTAAGCVKLALPILGDSKVMTMVCRNKRLSGSSMAIVDLITNRIAIFRTVEI